MQIDYAQSSAPADIFAGQIRMLHRIPLLCGFRPQSRGVMPQAMNWIANPSFHLAS
jgi:hypothetical protein